MSNDRTATDTIRGYYYQFDYSILQILSTQNDSETVTIEGIEDVDLHNDDELTAIQCKYYEHTSYSHSVVGKAIRLMLKHFHANTGKRDVTWYKLFGHYKNGQEKLVLPITVDFLKKSILTYTENKQSHILYKELSLSDAELTTFIDHLYIDIYAPSFTEQEQKTIVKLQEIFHCSKYDAEYFYYNNALRLIRKLATEPQINNRKITKRAFISEINTKAGLFDSWFLEYKGINQYCNETREYYFTQANISPYDRFFLIECGSTLALQKVKSIVLKVSENWSRLSAREPKKFCPYIYLHGLTPESIIDIKQLLQDDGIIFTDGYDFCGSKFNVKSITRSAASTNPIKLRFISELDQIDQILSELTNTRIIYEFYLTRPFYNTSAGEIHFIPITSTEDVSKMI